MFKSIFLFLLISFTLYSCEERFDSLSEEETYNESLLKNIHSNKEIDYLRIDLMSGGGAFKKEEYGNYKLSLKVPFPKNENRGSIFPGCQPSYCGYRIVYIEKNEWKFVTNKEELKDFIGEVDNKYEAFLIAKINGYDVDTSPEGNGYKRIDSGYKLKVMKYEICPQTKESFIVHVYKNGNLKQIKSLGYYYKSSCIIY